MTATLFEARATTPEELEEIDYAGDAYFEPDEVHFDEDAGVLVVPFAQQPMPELVGAPEAEVVERRGRKYTERIPYVRHEFRIAQIEKWATSRKERDAPGMLYGLEWRPEAREIRVT